MFQERGSLGAESKQFNYEAPEAPPYLQVTWRLGSSTKNMQDIFFFQDPAVVTRFCGIAIDIAHHHRFVAGFTAIAVLLRMVNGVDQMAGIRAFSSRY